VRLRSWSVGAMRALRLSLWRNGRGIVAGASFRCAPSARAPGYSRAI
jgi:hypothetical protein